MESVCEVSIFSLQGSEACIMVTVCVKDRLKIMRTIAACLTPFSEKARKKGSKIEFWGREGSSEPERERIDRPKTQGGVARRKREGLPPLLTLKADLRRQALLLCGRLRA